MTAGACMLYLAAYDVIYYAPIRKCTNSFLMGLANNAGQPSDQPIRTNIKDIHLDGDQAVINAGLAIPGSWINTQLYAKKNSNGYWNIVGVIEIDAHIQHPRDLQLASEIEHTFRSTPGIEVRRQ
ncbi:MAG: hypothetical protein JKY95_19020 [Planctomycetaceae bacterium]|nr:hypothetical protein [Planctomycetaceae bacterium]